jgi:tetratricopeptide (TPR) repeat protein
MKVRTMNAGQKLSTVMISRALSDVRFSSRIRFRSMGVSSLLKMSLAALALLAGGAASDAQSVDDLLKKGDVYDKKFEAQEALNFYLPAEKAEPKNAKVLLRIARQYRHLMSDSRSKWEKLKLGGMALAYAQRAVALAPNESEAHTSVAVSYGKLLPLQGAREQASASQKIKDAVDRALRLDPSNDTALNVLGRWHRVLADVSPIKRAVAPLVAGKLPTGSNEEAVKALQKAVSLNPKRPMHHIELGRAYAQMDRKEEAREELQRGLALPNMDKDDAEYKAHGREALSELR